MKMVEWVTKRYYYNSKSPEKYGESYILMTTRITAEDAIILQKSKMELENKVHNKTFNYESDEKALNDFVMENWGTIIEVE